MMNYLTTYSARLTAPDYYFTNVLYGKTAVKLVNIYSKLDESCSEPLLYQTVDKSCFCYIFIFQT